MRRLLFGFFGVCVVGFVLIAATTEEKCEHHKGKFCELKKDAKIEVSNIEDGVIIKITSDKPKLVKQIQERAAKWGSECKHDSDECKHKKHKHKEGSTECEKKCGTVECHH
ncbi:hypothetical protein KAW18_10300 [candidate division WOR-3 bacterium]|nr:hypothetical protein [candidate division WOR-3 bacterium]